MYAYLFSILVTAAAVGIRWLLHPWLGDHLVLVTLFGAVAAAVWFGGYRPALLAVILGYLACNYLFIEPRVSFGFNNETLPALIAYLVSCTFIIGFGEAMRRTQAQTQAQQELLRITLTSIGDAVITTDTEGRILSLNTVAESLTAWTQHEAAGQPLNTVFRIINEQTRQPVESPAMRALQEGTVVGLANHTLLIAKDGTERTIDDSAAPIRDEHGHLAGCVLVFRDVTEKRRAEKAQALLAAIVTASEDAIISKTLEGIILSWNRGAERLFGYTAAEAVGQSITLIIPPERQEEERLILEKLRRGQRIKHFETVRVSKEGRRIDISLTISPILDDTGRIIGASKIARDITGRKQAEKALRESEERFRTLSENIPQLAWMTQPDGWIFWYNQRWFDYTGTTLEQMQGWGWQAVHHPNHVARVTEKIKRAFESGEPWEDTFPLRGKDGQYRWFLSRAFPIRDASGNITRWFGTNTDITDLLQTQEALHQSQQRLELALQASQAGIWGWTVSENRIDGWNPQYRELYGFTPDETISFKAWLARVHPDDRERLSARFQQMLTTPDDNVWDEEFRILHPQRGERWLGGLGRCFRDERGQVPRMAGVNFDITERKRAAEALRDNEQRLRLALEAGRMGTWEWHIPTNTVTWSASLEALHGRTPGTFTGTFDAYQQDIHPDDREQVINSITAALEQGKEHHIEYRIVWADGSVHWVEGRGKLFQDEQGKPLRMIGICMDISDRKRYERELQEADRRKNEFLATLAHELRNPLAPIRNAVQILLVKDSPDPELQWARKIIDQQAQQMARLLDDLLDVSRIAHDKLELRKERIELATAIHNAVEISRPLIDSGGHELTIVLPPKPVYLNADPVRLAQIFSNLLNNAAKHTEEGSHIQLISEQQGSEIVISVKDDGIGIATEVLPRIFDIFSQEKRVLERSQGGLGIGLSLVRGLVELHGGNVEARSEGPGQGSEFIVRLPLLVQPAVERPQPQSKERKQAYVTKRRLLIVDDCKDSADSLAMLLKMIGHEVYTAYEGEEAIMAAAKLKPEVLLLDIEMPKLSGYDTCRHIRQQSWGKKMLLIAMTGWGQEDDRRRTKEAGFNYHMVKPVNPDALTKLLASLPPEEGDQLIA
ncbi:PAS domain S-box protein [Nitrosococcus wardiae]|uniref:histidine kinase n=1 Tax=Nitrosococcus wardiae TaxID=1814290 RepID=A0A4P7BXV5_9GAMM|nr:PAS domain S-box protein [Nitrosococcus wardiae]QBQ53960.1 MEKHLA domain-containing protein [Nitrosococcus wardiae]